MKLLNGTDSEDIYMFSEDFYVLKILIFNYVYKNEKKTYWQVGLYTFVVITLRRWHLCVETYRSLCMSCVLYQKVKFFWIIF